MQKLEPKLTVCMLCRSLKTKGFLKLPADTVSMMVAEYLTLAIWEWTIILKGSQRLTQKPPLFTQLFTATRGHLYSKPTPVTFWNFTQKGSIHSQQATHRHEGTFTSVTAHITDPQTRARTQRDTGSHLTVQGPCKPSPCLTLSYPPPPIYNKGLLISIRASVWHMVSTTWTRRTLTEDSSSWNRFKTWILQTCTRTFKDNI